MKKIKKLIWSILNGLRIGGQIQLLLNGALIEDGWYKSFHTKTSVNKNGVPVPWCTYPFIKFIEPRLKKEFDVFEFGCGNSTLWYAKRVNRVKSVEHDKTWLERMNRLIPSNAKLVHKELTEDGEYAKEVLNDSNQYDIIVIDGEDRNNCLKHSLSKLKSQGIIVYDNTDRTDYEQSYQRLAYEGFKRVDFFGLAPIVNVNSCTSVFYRENNCLGI